MGQTGIVPSMIARHDNEHKLQKILPGRVGFYPESIP